MSQINRVSQFDTIQVRQIIPIDGSNNRIPEGSILRIGNNGITEFVQPILINPDLEEYINNALLTFENQINSTPLQLDNITQSVATISSNVGLLNTDYTSTISSALYDISSLSSAIENIRSDSSSIADVSDLSGRISTLSGLVFQDISSLSSTVSGLSINLYKLSSTVSGMSINLYNLSSTVSGMSINLDNLSSTVSGLSINLDSLSSTVSGMSINLDNLSSTVSGLSINLDSLSSTVSGLSINLDNLSSTVSGLSIIIQSYTTQFSTATLIAGYGLDTSAGFSLNISGNTQIRGDISMNGRLNINGIAQLSTILTNTRTVTTGVSGSPFNLEVSGNAYIYGNIYAGRAIAGGKLMTYDTLPIIISNASIINLSGASDTGTYYMLNASGVAQTVNLPTTGIPNGYFYVFRSLNSSNITFTPNTSIIDSGATTAGGTITLDAGSTTTFIAANISSSLRWIRM